MFTGIIEEMGTVVSMQERHDLLLWNGELGTGWELIIKVKIALEGAYIGCSISVNGVCLTATSIEKNHMAFGVAPETLRKTNLGALQAGHKVNIERSMGANARISGHFVQGHVDGTGEILSMNREDDSLWVKIHAPKYIMKDILPKGYIAIDGTSLTVCEVNQYEQWFNVMLIAHTQQHIIIPKKSIGDLVNLEGDVMGKYASLSMHSVTERVASLEKKLSFTVYTTAIIGLVSIGFLVVKPFFDTIRK